MGYTIVCYPPTIQLPGLRLQVRAIFLPFLISAYYPTFVFTKTEIYDISAAHRAAFQRFFNVGQRPDVPYDLPGV